MIKFHNIIISIYMPNNKKLEIRLQNLKSYLSKYLTKILLNVLQFFGFLKLSY